MNTIDFCQNILNHLTSSAMLHANFTNNTQDDEDDEYDDDEEDLRDAYERSIRLVNPTSGQYL